MNFEASVVSIRLLLQMVWKQKYMCLDLLSVSTGDRCDVCWMEMDMDLAGLDAFCVECFLDVVNEAMLLSFFDQCHGTSAPTSASQTTTDGSK